MVRGQKQSGSLRRLLQDGPVSRHPNVGGAQAFTHPPGAEITAKGRRSHLPASHGSPNEGNRKAPDERRAAYTPPTYVVGDLKALRLVQARRFMQCRLLPQQIVQPNPAFSPAGIPGIEPAGRRYPATTKVRIRMLRQE